MDQKGSRLSSSKPWALIRLLIKPYISSKRAIRSSRRYTRPLLVKNSSQLCVLVRKKWSTTSSSRIFQSFLSPPLLKFVISATTATTILPNLLWIGRYRGGGSTFFYVWNTPAATTFSTFLIISVCLFYFLRKCCPAHTYLHRSAPRSWRGSSRPHHRPTKSWVRCRTRAARQGGWPVRDAPKSPTIGTPWSADLFASKG